MRKFLIFAGITFAGSLALVIIIQALRWLEVDRYLDRGGRWNYDQSVCDTA